MNPIADRLDQVRNRIAQAAAACGRSADDVRLLAVSKTRPAADIAAAFAAGQRAFGENYLQEAEAKIAEMAALPIEWHFIGRLQSNKTRPVAELFSWVHGLSSARHAERLSSQRPDALPALNACLQVNLSGEDSKGGVAPDDVAELARQVAGLPRLNLRGLMTLPAPTEVREEQEAVFRRLAALQQDINRQQGLGLDTLSMGMSGDLEAAVCAGSTLVRIGTAIFGARD